MSKPIGVLACEKFIVVLGIAAASIYLIDAWDPARHIKGAMLGIVGLVLLAIVGGGCGGTNEAGAFVGTWNPTSGNVTIACPGQPAQQVAVTSPDVFTAGTTSDLVLVDAGCSVLFDVQGKGASARPGQSCTDATSGEKLLISGWSFDVAGSAADESSTGTVLIGNSDCTYTEAAHFAKAGG